jgi:hypothetical protein
VKRLARGGALAASLLSLCACGKSSTSPTPPTTPAPTPPAASAFTATFEQNPVPFRSTACSFSTPQGWYTPVRLQETAGVAFTPATLTQKLDGNTVSFLAESFASRFGACSGMMFTPGVILANGAVCSTVGVCTASSYTTYQFSIAGTDANAHALTFDSPVLQLGPRATGQSISLARSSAISRAPEAMAQRILQLGIRP